MALSCDNLNINKDHCAVNYSPSRQECQAQAFVLHAINFTTEGYLAFVKEIFLLGKSFNTDYPKSVHYLISDNAVVYQLVELHDRAWGISELNDPSYSLLNQCSWSDHEDLFIHIGFIGQTQTQSQLDLASEIMCCVTVSEPSINIPSNEHGVIVARDIDSRQELLWDVPDSIIPKMQVCIQNEGQDPFYLDNIGTYGPRIDELESWREDIVDPSLIQLDECCTVNTAAIAQLQSQVDALETRVDDINVESLEQRLDALEEGNFAILKDIRLIKNCLNCANICAPETPVSIRYRLDLSTPAKLVPGVIQTINLPIKVNDVNPEVVTVGPLWHASLVDEEQTLCSTFKVKGSARLSSADWCAGSSLELYFIINSENILADTYIAEAGSQAAYVYGETIFTVPPDSIVRMGLKTDEDQSPLEVIQASIEIECLDGVITPACTDCPETADCPETI